MTPLSYLSVTLFLTGAPKRLRCITTPTFMGFSSPHSNYFITNIIYDVCIVGLQDTEGKE